jgi:hypothetical protein
VQLAASQEGLSSMMLVVTYKANFIQPEFSKKRVQTVNTWFLPTKLQEVCKEHAAEYIHVIF